jgi:hypothetical protein
LQWRQGQGWRSKAQVNQKFAIPLCPQQRGNNAILHSQIMGLCRAEHLEEDVVLLVRIAYHPPFADASFADFELWLNQGDDVRARLKEANQPWQQKAHGDKGDVNGQDAYPFW